MASLINAAAPDDAPDRQSASLLNRIARNPVGTEYAGPSMGMQRGPFDELRGMGPDGQPVMQSDLDAAHAKIVQAKQDATMMALGMASPFETVAGMSGQRGFNLLVNPPPGAMSRLLERGKGGARLIALGDDVAAVPAHDATHPDMFRALQDAAHPSVAADTGRGTADYLFLEKTKDGYSVTNRGAEVPPEQWPQGLRSALRVQ